MKLFFTQSSITVLLFTSCAVFALDQSESTDSSFLRGDNHADKDENDQFSNLRIVQDETYVEHFNSEEFEEDYSLSKSDVSDEEESQIYSASQRLLKWIFIEKTINNDEWYSEYSDDEVREYKKQDKGDEADELQSHDVCPKNNSYKRSNCPNPPSCKNVKQEWGKAKLCINRMPHPDNKNFFYVATMKCIPEWENCDKCSCGILDGNRCRFKSNGQRITDDRYSVNCNSRKTVTIKPYKSGKISFKPFDIKGGNGKNKDKKNKNKNKDKKNKNKNKDKKKKKGNKNKKKKKRMISGDSMDHSPVKAK
eukprot:CAMPEP_0194357336 /NCGR_PEP_ID=MMETSP0174-20130528/4830_1 /TAXON_ID=216777 /ORGANISM="Proboscia alata, Strain PI-D3" /LENGTH=307 /DNA_ID=CAMNT_0039127309 /DNA_START=113 /DNA_END=1036 /DNA_ORIENTATION=+